MNHAQTAYQQRRDELSRAMKDNQGSVALRKSTSNLFRSRQQGTVSRIDVRSMNHIIAIDEDALTLDVEGMTTYEDIVRETLKHGLMPPVVPQLKSITIGGGVSGLAIESSSWREGLTHESVLEMDVLTSSGDVVTCSPKRNSDLFYAMPNSYGTLGYILRLTVPLRRVKPYVRLRHIRFASADELASVLETSCESGRYDDEKFDFIDGTVISQTELYLTIGVMVESAPYTSDYTYMNIFWRSITERDEDYLTIEDYIWRWDTDWFWCSKNVGATNPLFRRLLGPRRLGSKTYQRMMRLEATHKPLERTLKLLGRYEPREAVIQDVQLPVARVVDFLGFFQEKIEISPVWLCPTRALPVGKRWPWTLYPMTPGQLYVNVGFWDTVPTTPDPAQGYYNRLVEQQLMTMDGTKSLYSDSYYRRADFEKLYNYADYRPIKQKYDPTARFKDLYDKCVKRK
ncbi:MAG: FAD-binding oxidoreductase [Candidatus Saccharimonadales bacterium]|jgi:FAD/FMN-containing dehydrogenase